MTVNRSRLNWGVFFIALGAVPLAVNVGLIDAATVAQLAAFWPVALIALGIGLILRFGPAHALGGLIVAVTFGLVVGAVIGGGARTPVGLACNNTNGSGTPVTATGAFETGGNVTAELSCVDLVMDGQAGNSWAVSAGSDGNRQPTINQSPDTLGLRSEPQRFFGPGPRLPWHVTVPQSVPLSVDLTTNATNGTVAPGLAQLGNFGFTLNASDVNFDLTGLAQLSFGGTLNASSSRLALAPEASEINGSLTLNASSLTLCVAPTTSLEIQLSDTLSSNNFADAGLVKSGNRWTAPGGAPGSAAISLNVTANVSSLKLDRSGGCGE